MKIIALDDEELALEGIARTERFFEALGMPVRLSQLPEGALDQEALEQLARRMQ